MEQHLESETQNGDTATPRSSSDVPAPVASTTSDKDDAVSLGEQEQAATTSPAPDSSPGATTPPYWQNHQRTASTASEASLSNLRPPPIQLEDHSDEDHEVGRACWAKHVSIDDYVVVGGGAIAGTYIVWNCTVETLKGAPFTIRKRLVSC
jgi:hypothetical protein